MNNRNLLNGSLQRTKEIELWAERAVCSLNFWNSHIYFFLFNCSSFRFFTEDGCKGGRGFRPHDDVFHSKLNGSVETINQDPDPFKSHSSHLCFPITDLIILPIWLGPRGNSSKAYQPTACVSFGAICTKIFSVKSWKLCFSLLCIYTLVVRDSYP